MNPIYKDNQKSWSRESLHDEHTTFVSNRDPELGESDIDQEMGGAASPPKTRFLPGQPMPNRQKYMLRQLGSLFIFLLIDVGLPLALYYGLRNVLPLVYALIIAGIPPVLWVLFTFIRKRRVDVLGVIIALSFIVSAIVSVVSGNARLALLRDGAVTAIVGGMFLITLIPIKTKWFVNRPLTFVIGRQMFSEAPCVSWIDKDGNEQEKHIVDWVWDEIRFFRVSMYAETAVWGIILILEFVIVVIMVESTLSVDDIVKYHNIMTGVVVGVMITFSAISTSIRRRKEVAYSKIWIKENVYTEYYENLRAQHGHRAPSDLESIQSR